MESSTMESCRTISQRMVKDRRLDLVPSVSLSASFLLDSLLRAGSRPVDCSATEFSPIYPDRRAYVVCHSSTSGGRTLQPKPASPTSKINSSKFVLSLSPLTSPQSAHSSPDNQVAIQHEKWDEFTTCFTAMNVELPPNPFLGFSAHTGDVHGESSHSCRAVG